jgi:DNA repair exonuclease SbcCD ATPase subunit
MNLFVYKQMRDGHCEQIVKTDTHISLLHRGFVPDTALSPPALALSPPWDASDVSGGKANGVVASSSSTMYSLQEKKSHIPRAPSLQHRVEAHIAAAKLTNGSPGNDEDTHLSKPNNDIAVLPPLQQMHDAVLAVQIVDLKEQISGLSKEFKTVADAAIQQEAASEEIKEMQEQVQQLSRQFQSLLHEVQSQSQEAASSEDKFRSLPERVQALEEMAKTQADLQKVQLGIGEDKIAAVHDQDGFSTGTQQASGGAVSLGNAVDGQHIIHQRIEVLAKQVESMSRTVEKQSIDIQTSEEQLATLVQEHCTLDKLSTEVESISMSLEHQSKCIQELAADLDGEHRVRQLSVQTSRI